MELHGERVVLRTWSDEDKSHLIRHANNPNVARNLRNAFPQPYTKADADAWVTHAQSLGERALALAILFEGAAIGGIGGQFQEDVHHRTFEIGYWVGEEYWRRGLASEALNLLCDHLFSETDCVRIEARTYEWNEASSKMLLKHGFEVEARLRCSIEKDGKLSDMVLHARLRPGVSRGNSGDSYDILSL